MAGIVNDPSLAAGSALAQGVQGFLTAYRQTKKDKLDEAQQLQEQALRQKQADLSEKQYGAGLAEHGLVEGDDGTFTYTPEKQQEKDLDRANKFAGMLEKGAKPTSGFLADEASKYQLFVPPAKQAELDAAKFRAQATTDARNRGLDIRERTQAQRASDDINNDSLIKTKTTMLDQLTNAKQILNRDKITVQDFNAAQQEYEKAVQGAAAATDSKVEATKYNSWYQELKNGLQKVTGNPQDSVPPQLVARQKAAMLQFENNVKADRYEQAKRKHASLMQIYGDSDKAANALDTALKNYEFQKEELPKGFLKATPPPNGTSLPLTDQDKQAIEWAQQNPNDPDAKQILKLHGLAK